MFQTSFVVFLLAHARPGVENIQNELHGLLSAVRAAGEWKEHGGRRMEGEVEGMEKGEGKEDGGRMEGEWHDNGK